MDTADGRTRLCVVDSPVGLLTLAARDGALTGLWMAGQRHFGAGLAPDAVIDPFAPPFPAVRAWLRAYFAGQNPDAAALPLDPPGTAFQRRVWQALRQIPFGRTVTYQALARSLDSAPRAVGGAVGRNPISLLIPCHRVLGADGSLTGYAGGLQNKKRLLALEGILYYNEANITEGSETMKDTIHLRLEHKPLMIAHRGMSGLEKENTASAFVAAGQRSHYGIETDVHRTADGQFIIIHDDRTGRVACDDLPVEGTDFDTLRGLQLLDTDGQKGRRDLMLPTLSEYLGICKKYEKIAVLELKNPFAPDDIDRILAIVRASGWLERTVFISFCLDNLLHVRACLPDQPIQYLIEQRVPEDLADTLTRNRLDLDIDYHLVTPELVRQLHALGVRVNVWTVNDADTAARMAACGVDYITTNILE